MQKRLRAVDEIVDWQIENILRTMTSYKTNSWGHRIQATDILEQLDEVHTLTESEAAAYLMSDQRFGSSGPRSETVGSLTSEDHLFAKVASDWRDSHIKRTNGQQQQQLQLLKPKKELITSFERRHMTVMLD